MAANGTPTSDVPTAGSKTPVSGEPRHHAVLVPDTNEADQSPVYIGGSDPAEFLNEVFARMRQVECGWIYVFLEGRRCPPSVEVRSCRLRSPDGREFEAGTVQRPVWDEKGYFDFSNESDDYRPG